jgi:CBS domain-containing protein
MSNITDSYILYGWLATSGMGLAQFQMPRREYVPLEKRVRDIIRPLDQYLKIHAEDTARDVLCFMERAHEEKRPLCLLVVEGEVQGDETIKGFITPREVVFGLATRFLKGAGKSGPIFWEGQLAQECIDGLKKQVGDIMDPIDVYVRDNEMLLEAVFLLYKSGKEFLPVADKEEVIGTIHMGDLFEEMIEITASSKVAVPEKKRKKENILKQKEVRHV